MLTQASYESKHTSGRLSPSAMDCGPLCFETPPSIDDFDEEQLAFDFGLVSIGVDDEGVELFDFLQDPFVRITGTLKPEPVGCVGSLQRVYEPWPDLGYGTHAPVRRYETEPTWVKVVRRSTLRRKRLQYRRRLQKSLGVDKAFSMGFEMSTAKPGSQFRSGGKHRKDVGRRMRPRKKVDRKRHRRLFDSTLGYPGEGPPRARPVRQHHVLRCYNCRQVGHLAGACPLPPQDGQGRRGRRPVLADDPPQLPPAALRGLPAQQAADAVDILDGKHGPVVEPVHPERRVKTPEEKRDEVRAEMLAYAEVAFLTKNLASIADRRVVIRAVGAIAKRTTLNLQGTTMSDFVLGVIEEAMLRARASRLTMGRQQHPIVEMSPGEAVNSGISLEALPSPPEGDPITQIEAYEALRPWTNFYVLVDKSYWPYHLSAFMRVFAVALLEESVKTFFLTYQFITFGEWLRQVGFDAYFCDLSVYQGAVSSKLRQNTNWDYCVSYDVYMHMASLWGLLPIIFLILFLSNLESVFNGHFWSRICMHSLFPFLGWLVHGSRYFGLALCLHFVWNVCAFHLKRPDYMMDSLVLRVREALCLEGLKTKVVGKYAEYKVELPTPQCQPHFGGRQFFGFERFIASFHNLCTHNERVSMDGRVGKLCPVHSDLPRVKGNWRRCIRQDIDSLKSLIDKVRRPYPYTQWAATFPPGKREMLLKLREESFCLPRVLKASSFIKWEPTLRCEEDIGTAVEKDPRFIQGCPVELTAFCGPSVRRLAKNVREGFMPTQFLPDEIKAGKQIVYTCGLSLEKIGELFHKAILCITEMCEQGDSLVYVEDDQSRFDLHLTEGPFMFLNSVYRDKLPRRVASALRRDISRGRTSFGTRYSVPYTMQSGWPDTSVGDTLVNIFMKRSVHGVGRPWLSIVCGDDSVTVTTRSEVERIGGVMGIRTSYADFGMEVEVKVTSDPLLVEFCSARFIPVCDSYVLSPKVGKLLARLGWDGVDRTAQKQLEWLASIGQTLKQFGKIDPILRTFATALEQVVGVGERLPSNEYVLFSDGSVEVSWHDYLLYVHTHYSLSEGDVLELCSVLSSWKGGYFDHPYLELMAETDL